MMFTPERIAELEVLGEELDRTGESFLGEQHYKMAMRLNNCAQNQLAYLKCWRPDRSRPPS
jgi:hypothetical protein